MSKSLARVTTALADAGLAVEVLEMSGETRTAQQAADQAGCALDQIAKSILFEGTTSGALYLFITAGGRQVDPDKAAGLAGEPLGRADGKKVRAVTGFAIGGVAPLGHLTPPRAYFDPRLLDFEVVWAAAGTPRHVFSTHPTALLAATGAHPGDFTA